MPEICIRARHWWAEAPVLTRPAGVAARIALRGGDEWVCLSGTFMGEEMAAIDLQSAGREVGKPGLATEIAGGAEAVTLTAD